MSVCVRICSQPTPKYPKIHFIAYFNWYAINTGLISWLKQGFSPVCDTCLLCALWHLIKSQDPKTDPLFLLLLTHWLKVVTTNVCVKSLIHISLNHVIYSSYFYSYLFSIIILCHMYILPSQLYKNCTVIDLDFPTNSFTTDRNRCGGVVLLFAVFK